ncbi:hypothetical protein SAMN05421858_3624 [Haladaptatus litoreus]|uniref:Uncharacterized protein n=1 Tax=Haladaptatus litoreus TaxID=553468 RepID=A0A1N7DHJ8_9EURY|nr:hypothetical protein SAMN05421858_3624 [Haladaptatus litoreus]
MSHAKSDGRNSELLWGSLAVGSFSITILVYLRLGFVESFLPLLVGIFFMRRSMAQRVAGGRKNQQPRDRLVEKYGIPDDRAITRRERIEILSEIRSSFRKKRALWGVLGIVSVVLACVFIPITVLVTLTSMVVAMYCFSRFYRTHETLRYIDRAISKLST